MRCHEYSLGLFDDRPSLHRLGQVFRQLKDTPIGMGVRHDDRRLRGERLTQLFIVIAESSDRLAVEVQPSERVHTRQDERHRQRTADAVSPGTRGVHRPTPVGLDVIDTHEADFASGGQARTFAGGVLGVVESLRSVVRRTDRDRPSPIDQRHARRRAVGQLSTTGLSDTEQRTLQVGIVTDHRLPQRVDTR